ncbi:MAG: IMP cyclohydrolase [Myxococcales bacterium]|nr:IMP cyclohydrolase [Myxococcales bacterium]
MEPRASLDAEAAVAFAALRKNPYPGRGLVIGRAAEDDAWLVVYWIMGRSAHSRNRRFVADGPELRTEPVDAAAVEDPSLIIYEAMLELPGCYLVTNGDQTRTLRDGLEKGESFEAALRSREREPDAPNFTPRISGLLDLRADPTVWLSLLRADPVDPERTERTTFELVPPPAGLGRGLTTYEGDGSPLPSFRGEPTWLPLSGSADAVLDAYWDALDSDNRVALAVKRVTAGGSADLRVRNRFEG